MADLPTFTRRTVLHGLSATLAATALAPLAPLPARAGNVREFHLKAAPHKVRLIGDKWPETEVWAYNGSIPGPVLRARQGERIRVTFENALPQPSTVHWHGQRLPNAMDGVPYLTQDPVPPGGRFVYEFDAVDAGTYWYHPHFNSSEQIGRGLAGALIVDEAEPAPADQRISRDVLWVLDDWRLAADATIAPFGNWHDMSHAGRIGNTVTLNGRVVEGFPVTAGERIRLRIVNVANAREFGLSFTGHNPWLVAVDGHPVQPQPVFERQILIGAGGRADLILDMTGRPGEAYTVVDDAYPRFRYRLADLAYGAGAPADTAERPIPARLPATTIARPDLVDVVPFTLTMAGGAMGQLTDGEVAGEHLDRREMAQRGLFWTMNGVAWPHMEYGRQAAPMFTVRKNDNVRLRLINSTQFNHPIHLHGHAFDVLSRNGAKTHGRVLQDTILVPAQEEAMIAFVADNPGDWMLHCHVLEHQMSGMMGYFRVTA